MINGYSDIMSRYNLVGNGNFIINQRSSFPSLSLISTSDYIADMWYCAALDIDFCQCRNYNDGKVAFSGYGQKGQTIQIDNSEKHHMVIVL